MSEDKCCSVVVPEFDSFHRSRLNYPQDWDGDACEYENVFPRAEAVWGKMGKWRKFTGDKNRNKPYRSTTVVPSVVYEGKYAPLKYPKSNIRIYAERNRAIPTPAERRLELILANHSLFKNKFKTQYPISGKWIVDFFFPEVRLAIEVDGYYHKNPNQRQRDRMKEADCQRFDITLIRIHNREVFGDKERLKDKLKHGYSVATNRDNKIIGRRIT